jgi:hypothetical protein
MMVLVRKQIAALALLLVGWPHAAGAEGCTAQWPGASTSCSGWIGCLVLTAACALLHPGDGQADASAPARASTIARPRPLTPVRWVEPLVGAPGPVPVPIAPPREKEPEYVPVEKPSPDQVWVPGCWVWDGARWVWANGRWMRPPGPSFAYRRPRYWREGARHFYFPAHWEATEGRSPTVW